MYKTYSVVRWTYRIILAAGVLFCSMPANAQQPDAPSTSQPAADPAVLMRRVINLEVREAPPPKPTVAVKPAEGENLDILKTEVSLTKAGDDFEAQLTYTVTLLKDTDYLLNLNNAKAPSAVNVLRTMRLPTSGMAPITARASEDDKTILLRCGGLREETTFSYRQPASAWHIRYTLDFKPDPASVSTLNAVAHAVNDTAYPWTNVELNLVRDGLTYQADVPQLESKHTGDFPVRMVQLLPIHAERFLTFDVTAPNEPVRVWYRLTHSQSTNGTLPALIPGSVDILYKGGIVGTSTLATLLPWLPAMTTTGSTNVRDLGVDQHVVIGVKFVDTPSKLVTSYSEAGFFLLSSATRTFTFQNAMAEDWILKLKPTPSAHLASFALRPSSTTIKSFPAERQSQRVDIRMETVKNLESLQFDSDPAGLSLSGRRDVFVSHREAIDDLKGKILRHERNIDGVRERQALYQAAGLTRQQLPILYRYQDQIKELQRQLGDLHRALASEQDAFERAMSATLQQ